MLVAVTAVVDPEMQSLRRGRSVVSVVASHPARDSALLAITVRLLNRHYTVIPELFPAAEATVVVGAELPSSAARIASPAIVVSSVARDPDIILHHVEAPSRAALDSRVTVAVTFTTPARVSDSVNIELAEGNVVVARERRGAAHDSLATAAVSFVPTRAVPTVLQLRAFAVGGRDTVRHDILIDVRSTRWSVLFFDRRPSWTSTFVRRALERDPRFAVSSRIVTSTDISRETGPSPQDLSDVARGTRYDVVVVGSPDALNRRDIDALTALLNERGASVVVLPDHQSASPTDAWLGIERWTTTRRRDAVDIVSPPVAGLPHDPVRLRGMAIGVPLRLPVNAETVAELPATSDSASPNATRAGQAVIWRVPVGLGTLVVSGVFDAWRYRDPAQSTFDATWRDIINDAASRRQPSVDLRVTPAIVTPRSSLDAIASFRDARDTGSVTVDWRAATDSSAAATVIPMYATSAPDQRVGSFRAPQGPGVYTVRLMKGADTIHVPLAVLSRIAHDIGNNTELLDTWSASRGGRVVAREQLDSVPAILEQVIKTAPRLTTWHPMRSPWWIVPFAMLLSCEWWLRRRRGQP